jgi:hypothetical protein
LRGFNPTQQKEEIRMLQISGSTCESYTRMCVDSKPVYVILTKFCHTKLQQKKDVQSRDNYDL